MERFDNLDADNYEKIKLPNPRVYLPQEYAYCVDNRSDCINFPTENF